MKQWAPKPLRALNVDGIFKISDEITVVKEVLNPMQRQRRIDGTPYTVGARTALRPEGPKLTLNNVKIEKSQKIEKSNINPDEIIKAYLNKND